MRKGTASTMNVIFLRVVRVGPDYTYPVEICSRVIARDEVDYKCIYLFDRQREDAQLINSEVHVIFLSYVCSLNSIYMFIESR